MTQTSNSKSDDLSNSKRIFLCLIITKNAKVDLTTTNNTTVYTCPTATQTIVKSILVNDDKW